jgi:hypothetical protein
MLRWVLIILLMAGSILTVGEMNSRENAHAGRPDGELVSHSSFLRNVDTSDGSDLRRWAEQMCYRETINGLAKTLGVTPSLDAVVAAVTHGFPDSSRAIVRKVFGEQLR